MEIQHVIKLMEQLDYISPRASQKLLTLTKVTASQDRSSRIQAGSQQWAGRTGHHHRSSQTGCSSGQKSTRDKRHRCHTCHRCWIAGREGAELPWWSAELPKWLMAAEAELTLLGEQPWST